MEMTKMDIDCLLDYGEFYRLTRDILTHEEFLKLKGITHHGMTRFHHSLRVAKISYKITKCLCLDYRKTARAALLHDFFLEDNLVSDTKTKIKTLVMHPEYALANAEEYFSLSDLEKDIITTHMFPVGKKIPKYLESWIVDFVDDAVAVYEKCYGVRKQLSFASSFLFFLMMNKFK